jgi:hypothetical protein
MNIAGILLSKQSVNKLNLRGLKGPRHNLFKNPRSLSHHVYILSQGLIFPGGVNNKVNRGVKQNLFRPFSSRCDKLN